ncbi:MAG: glycosyltransferase [Cyclobacteriaceae bacterium]
MELTNKNILLVSPEPWTHLHVSKHHYARYLAQRGNNVWFLNPPSKKVEQAPTENASLNILNYTGFPRGIRFYPAFIRRLFTRRVFWQLESLVYTSFDVIWSFDNSVFFQMDALPSNVLKISHIVDLNQDFEMELAAQTADFAFCTSQAIKARLERYAPNKTYWINHGLSVNETNWNGSLGELPGKNEIKAVYAGNLSMMYLDWYILFETARINHHVDFIFFGSNWENYDLSVNAMHSWKKQMFELDNVHSPGKVRTEDLQCIFESADVLLIAYQQAYHVDQSNPHKTLEYLYSGKPIVATNTAEYAEKKLLNMCENNAEWPKLFSNVTKNIELYSTPELATERRSFALENTYEKQIERIEKVLSDNGY